MVDNLLDKLRDFLSENLEDGKSSDLDINGYQIHVEFSVGPGVSVGSIEKDGSQRNFQWDMYSNKLRFK